MNSLLVIFLTIFLNGVVHSATIPEEEVWKLSTYINVTVNEEGDFDISPFYGSNFSVDSFTIKKGESIVVKDNHSAQYKSGQIEEVNIVSFSNIVYFDLRTLGNELSLTGIIISNLFGYLFDAKGVIKEDSVTLFSFIPAIIPTIPFVPAITSAVPEPKPLLLISMVLLFLVSKKSIIK